MDASAQYAYSSDLPSTPTLNQLAEEGLVFENVWATPQCTTTRATIMTGKHGVNRGINFVPAVMDTASDTLFRALATNQATSDYAGAVFGKWHLGGGNPDVNHPEASGVEFFSGVVAGNVTDYFSWSHTTNGETETSDEYQTSKITDLAIDWIGQQNTPWFAWVAYGAPHSPFHLPPAALHSDQSLPVTSEDINANRREYYLAAIEAMDSEIGRLLDGMSEEERANTVIIYVGDNGTPTQTIDESVFPRSYSKSSLYEGGVRVPMTISGATVSRINQREEALVNTTDLYATILSIAGSDLSTVYDAHYLSPLLSSSQAGPRIYNYTEAQGDKASGWAVRNDTYKLIEFDDGQQELYDLSQSIREESNLLDSATDYSFVVSQLAAFAEGVRGGEVTTGTLDITDMFIPNQCHSQS